MKDIRQVTPLNATVSYNNASLSVAGRIIEKITGKTYEAAMRELVLDPLGLDDTLFFMTEIMMRRFAVGHVQEDDGSIHLAPSWAIPRGNAPAGGMSATAADQIRWARFHLGDGTAADGSRILSAESVARMQEPTVSMPGSALGDHVASVGCCAMSTASASLRTAGPPSVSTRSSCSCPNTASGSSR